MGGLWVSTVNAEGAKQNPAAQPWVETASSEGCTIGGCGRFSLTVNKIQRGGTQKVTLDVSPQDNVGSIVDLLEPNKMAELRHHGEFENLAKDLNLLDVGVSQPMQVDLMISDMMKGPH